LPDMCACVCVCVGVCGCGCVGVRVRVCGEGVYVWACNVWVFW